jgi:hypothetical protein
VGGKAEDLVLKVARREETKWRSGERTRSHPSEEDRWQRSRGLANSGVHRVRAQVLGTQSHGAMRSEKKNSCWIWIRGEPSDLHVGLCIRVSLEKTRGFGHGDHDIAISDISTIGGQCGP